MVLLWQVKIEVQTPLCPQKISRGLSWERPCIYWERDFSLKPLRTLPSELLCVFPNSKLFWKALRIFLILSTYQRWNENGKEKKPKWAPLAICSPQIPHRLKNTVLFGEMSETDKLWLRGGRMKLFFRPVLPDFRKKIPFWKFSQASASFPSGNRNLFI